MKNTFEEIVTVGGIEWLIKGDFLFPAPSTFYDPGQDLLIEDYEIFINTAGEAGEIDMGEVLDNKIHEEILKKVERRLAGGVPR